MKKIASLLVLVLTTSAFAFEIPLDEQIKSIQTIELTADDSDSKEPKVDPHEEIGKVIKTTKDLVALGETIYDLVKKGRPTSTTTYAAISVVPKDPTTKEYVSPFDLEGFTYPKNRLFKTKIKSASGKTVVTFEYNVVYSFGGSFDGKGLYLTNVMIVPQKIETAWGWDFNATMSLQGIMNHGSKDSPVAGAMVALKYQVTSWSKSFEANDVIHITGRGEIKSFGLQ